MTLCLSSAFPNQSPPASWSLNGTWRSPTRTSCRTPFRRGVFPVRSVTPSICLLYLVRANVFSTINGPAVEVGGDAVEVEVIAGAPVDDCTGCWSSGVKCVVKGAEVEESKLVDMFTLRAASCALICAEATSFCVSLLCVFIQPRWSSVAFNDPPFNGSERMA